MMKFPQSHDLYLLTIYFQRLFVARISTQCIHKTYLLKEIDVIFLLYFDFALFTQPHQKSIKLKMCSQPFFPSHPINYFLLTLCFLSISYVTQSNIPYLCASMLLIMVERIRFYGMKKAKEKK